MTATSDDLVEVYKKVLSFTGMQCDAEGKIELVAGTATSPATVNNRPLLLPTNDNLKNAPKDVIFFHPFTESRVRGESDVFRYMKLQLNIKLNYTTLIIMQYLLELVYNKDKHKQLRPDQLAILSSINSVTKTFLDKLIAYVARSMSGDNKDRIVVNIYARNGGKVKNENYYKAGIVSFPMYREISKEGVSEFEKFTEKELHQLRLLFQFIFPNIDSEEYYNAGSRSEVCPYADSLLRSGALLAADLNSVLETYKDFIPMSDLLMFNVDWIDSLENEERLARMVKRIPVLFGNDGNVIPKQDEPVVNPLKAAVDTTTMPARDVGGRPPWDDEDRRDDRRPDSRDDRRDDRRDSYRRDEPPRQKSLRDLFEGDDRRDDYRRDDYYDRRDRDRDRSRRRDRDDDFGDRDLFGRDSRERNDDRGRRRELSTRDLGIFQRRDEY